MNQNTIALSNDEIRDVTRKKRPSAQIRALRAMGIDHRVRPDGSVLVLRDSLVGDAPAAKTRAPEINWK